MTGRPLLEGLRPRLTGVESALFFAGLPVDLNTVLPLACGHELDLGPALEHGSRLARFMAASMLQRPNRLIWCGFCCDFVLPTMPTPRRHT